jgi:hypothetical protein
MISRGRTPTASMLQLERTGIRTGSFIRKSKKLRSPTSCRRCSVAPVGLCQPPPSERSTGGQLRPQSDRGRRLKTWLRQAGTAARLCVVMHLLMSEEPRLSLPRPRWLTCSAAFLASRQSMTVRASTCLGIAELGVILDGDRRRSASILRRKCLAICRPPGTGRYLLSIYHPGASRPTPHDHDLRARPPATYTTPHSGQRRGGSSRPMRAAGGRS